ncbi:MAG: TetR/AcrR family transcriptional regulator [Acidimicrobiales bacterium]
MAKPGARSRAGREKPGAASRERIVDAALATLKAQGVAGASARAIAGTGGFAQALIFYHFGSVNELLLAALEETGRRRMGHYRKLVGEAKELPDLVRAASEVYREDLEAGHLTVLAAMIAASVTSPDLGPRVTACLRPWLELTEEVVARGADLLPVPDLVGPADAAVAIVALYLGLELLTHLDGDRSRAESLFAAAARVADMVGALTSPSP